MIVINTFVHLKHYFLKQILGFSNIYYLAHIKCVKSIEYILHNPTHQVNNSNAVLEE